MATRSVPTGGSDAGKLYAAGALQAGTNPKLTAGLGKTALHYLQQRAAKDPEVQAQLQAFENLRDAAAKAPKDLGVRDVKREEADQDTKAEGGPSTLSKVARFSGKALKYGAIAAGLTVAASAYVPVFCAAPVATTSAIDIGFCAAAVGPATTFNAGVAAVAGPVLAAGSDAAGYLYENSPALTERFANWQAGKGFILNS